MSAVWVVRTGKHGERDSWALENSLDGGGWDEVPDLTQCTSREEVLSIVQSVYGTEKPGAIPNYTGQLWSLRGRIAPGDLIVLPLKTTSQLAFGRVTSGYEYLNSESDPTRRHVVRVTWLRTDVARTAVKQDLLFILGAFLTVFQPTSNDAAWRLEQVAETGSDPGARPDVTPPASAAEPVSEGDATADSLFDLEEYARARVQTLIQEIYSGHDLARLVEAVLAADGFRCERKPPGADGGVDILAGRGPLGLDSPKVVVQVKSDTQAVGDPVVQTLQGAITRFSADQALLVAWGGVTRQAGKFLETTKFTIRVWGANELMDAVFRTYPILPESIKAELPLRQIWTPVD